MFVEIKTYLALINPLAKSPTRTETDAQMRIEFATHNIPTSSTVKCLGHKFLCLQIDDGG